MKNNRHSLTAKEWRESCGIFMALLFGLAALRLATRNQAPIPMDIALCFAATLLGARLFAHEREGMTMPFLLRLPISPWVVWRAKTMMGLAQLVALYPMALGFNQMLFALPVLLFGAALFMSVMVDNVMLALVGGAAVGYVCLIGIVLAVGTDILARSAGMGALCFAVGGVFIAAGAMAFVSRCARSKV